jgi:1,2-diacylglycerol 3-beta-galactosyltransferase
MHLRDVLDPVDVFRRVLRVDLQELYNRMLRRGWTLGSKRSLRVMQRLIRLYHRSEVRLLRNWWQQRPADMAVSLVPNFNRALYEAWRRAAPGSPYVTVLTDLADYPPHFWMERQPQYFICGTPRAVQQARAMGHPEERVFLTSGMILQPSFYDLPPLDRTVERLRLGLDPNVVTGLVLFGGYGSKAIARIAQRLEPLAGELQLILIAGRSAKLEKTLRTSPSSMRRHVVGFTSQVPYYMRLADFFIGKPGPGSLSEAVHMGLPCITVRNALTLPQERYNADWLTQNGYGIVLKSFRHIERVVEERILRGDELNKMRRRAAAAENRAVFEIPAILMEILRRGA